jgi:hypothetical protein
VHASSTTVLFGSHLSVLMSCTSPDILKICTKETMQWSCSGQWHACSVGGDTARNTTFNFGCHTTLRGLRPKSSVPAHAAVCTRGYAIPRHVRAFVPCYTDLHGRAGLHKATIKRAPALVQTHLPFPDTNTMNPSSHSHVHSCPPIVHTVV